MASSFSAPFVYWVGLNNPFVADAESVRAYNEFYSAVHVPEFVEANQFAGGSRYELVASTKSGSEAPRWLAVYEAGSEDAAQGYLGRAHGPIEGRPTYTQGPFWGQNQTVWRLMWRGIDNRSPADDPAGILVVGSCRQPDLDGLGADVLADYGFGRCVRLDLVDALAHPTGPAPSSCVVFEGNETGAGGLPAYPAFQGAEKDWAHYFRRVRYPAAAER